MKQVKDCEGVLKAEDLLPGQKTSVDHFVCSAKGRLFESKGKTKDKVMYSGGAIFVDHASSLVHVSFHKHLNTHETLKSKEAYKFPKSISQTIALPSPHLDSLIISNS